MKRYAVIVASDSYTSVRPSPHCHSDARLLHETLIGSCDYAERDVDVLLLSPEHPSSPSEMVQRIRRMSDRSQVGDTILFYYAGHGHVHDGEPYLILPGTEMANVQQTAIPLRDISDVLRVGDRINVRLFDACRSGFDVRHPSDMGPDSAGFTRVIRTDPSRGWITFAACRDDEESRSDPALRNGVFTYFLCEALREWEPDADVFPEVLKVRVCDKVSDWCASNECCQTPTLNASISGNLSIARRRPHAEIDDAARATNPCDTLARIEAIRAVPSVTSTEYHARLSELVESIRRSVVARVADVESYGCPVEVTAPARAEVVPVPFKSAIASYVDERDARPVHSVRVEERRPPLGLFGIQGYFTGSANLPAVTRTYVVEQPALLPPCYLELSITSDGYLPSGTAFFYLLPFRTKVAILVGVAVDAGPFPSAHHARLRDFFPVGFGIYADDVEAVVRQAVERAIRSLNLEYKEAVERLLRDVDAENGMELT